MKRLVVAGPVAGALAASVFVSGLLVGRSMDDDGGGEEITEVEESRLVGACTDAGPTQAECVSWIAGVVERAEERGTSYADLAQMIGDVYECVEFTAESAQRECMARRLAVLDP
jgi:hypothetical protein